MIPRLYKWNCEDFNSNGEGLLTEAYDWDVCEELNGDFTAEFKYPVNGRLYDLIQRGNFIKAHASRRLKNQKFRIYNIAPSQNGMEVKVKCRHKSFDTVTDFIPAQIELTKESCEYALNEIFKQSLYCKNYIGYSDVEQAQNFSIGYVNPAQAIKGTRGSIVDTYGNGVHIERDNETADSIGILKNRGKTSGVLMSYGKNITGFDGNEDDTDLVTRIIPFAKYNDENNEEVIIRPTSFRYVDSENAEDFYGIYFTKEIDFSDKFEDDVIPTEKDLKAAAEKYFKDNKCNYPKISYKINFESIDTTTIVGENLDKLYDVGMADTVLIWHSLFKIRTEARVITTHYDPVTEEYLELILGDPRISLDEILNSDDLKGDKGDPGKDGEPGKDGDMGDFPDVLPATPVVSLVAGLGVIEITWTYDNEMYYTYELYGSQIADFKPTVFDLLYSGKASTFLHQAEPNQTWYYYVRVVNTHGNATPFSELKSISTYKISDGSIWFEEAAIGDALIGNLRLDRGWIGQLEGTYINAKNLTVTDGAGSRTLDIDSYGNVSIKATEFQLLGKTIADMIDEGTNAAIEEAQKEFLEDVNDVYDYMNNFNTELWKDSIIDEADRKIIEQQLQAIDREKADIDSKYNILINNPNLV